MMKFVLFVGVCLVLCSELWRSVLASPLETPSATLKGIRSSNGSRNVGESSGDNKKEIIIIGASVGGGLLVTIVFFVVLIIILWFCCKRYVCNDQRPRYSPVLYEPLLEEAITDRIKEANVEKENAWKATNYYLARQKHGVNGELNQLPDIGSRVQKYWYQATVRQDGTADASESVLITNAPITRYCALLEGGNQTQDKTLTLKTIDILNGLCKKLKQNPYIRPIIEIGYVDDRKQVITIQSMTEGSLKDKIYGVSPIQDWAEKYPVPRPSIIDDYIPPGPQSIEECCNRHCCCCCWWCLLCRWCAYCWWYLCCCFLCFAQNTRKTFHSDSADKNSSSDDSEEHMPVPVKIPVNDIAVYGWQILKAMTFLYKQGFPVLGHVQSGNIFVKDGVCRLGGYENTLLGYRSRFYRMCQDHLDHMDVIMFGHLVFEMCCGYELTTLVPTDRDYQAVRDVEGGEKVEKVLIFIFSHFEEDYATVMPSNMEMIKSIKNHQFFRSGKGSATDKPEGIGHKVLKGLWKPFPAAVGGDKVILSSDEKALLKRVHQGAIQPEIQECQDLSQSGGPHDE